MRSESHRVIPFVSIVQNYAYGPRAFETCLLYMLEMHVSVRSSLCKPPFVCVHRIIFQRVLEMVYTRVAFTRGHRLGRYDGSSWLMKTRIFPCGQAVNLAAGKAVRFATENPAEVACGTNLNLRVRGPSMVWNWARKPLSSCCIRLNSVI
jgi:hypothetical protein